MLVSQILKQKGDTVFTTTPSETIAAVAGLLQARGVGALVVLDAGQIAGIVSERDVVRRLNDRGPALLDGPVSEIMTTLVASCGPEDSVDQLSVLMTERRIRHVPVLANGRLAGIISIGDVVKNRMEQLEKSQEQLEAYISQG
jgi:CBS domain-containing protein